MASLLDSNCKGCVDREPNCHVTCQKYRDWLELYHKVKKEEKVEQRIGYSRWLEKYKHRGLDEKDTK